MCIEIQIENVASGCRASSLFVAQPRCAVVCTYVGSAYQRMEQYVILHVVQFSILIVRRLYNRPKLSSILCNICPRGDQNICNHGV